MVNVQNVGDLLNGKTIDDVIDSIVGVGEVAQAAILAGNGARIRVAFFSNIEQFWLRNSNHRVNTGHCEAVVRGK